MFSRRQLLKGIAALSFGSVGFGGYAIAEPFRLDVTRYRVTPPRWPRGLNLKLAVLTDIHACEPWMPAERVRQIAARTNELSPDATLLLGDYVAGHRLSRMGSPVPHEAWAEALGELHAPLGVHAVLGNHDWWDDPDVQLRRAGPVKSRRVLEANGIVVYENDAVRLAKSGHEFWLAGLGDQWAFWSNGKRQGRRRAGDSFAGVDDLPRTLAQVPEGAPLVLMAHEPDIFPEVPDRVSLTVAGHTHGGQICLAGFAPVVPSRYGQRYVYGHVVENDRHLVVSGGLGCSGIPLRFGSPPEIVLIEVGAATHV